MLKYYHLIIPLVQELQRNAIPSRLDGVYAEGERCSTTEKTYHQAWPPSGPVLSEVESVEGAISVFLPAGRSPSAGVGLNG